MALFRKLFYRKPPDGLLEICDQVYVFDCCFSTDVWEEKNYKVYMGGVVSQLREHFPEASYLVFNFCEAGMRSVMAEVLSEYDMTIMDYPRHYEGCPLLPMEVMHHFLRSSESWLSLGPNNMLLMHCERGGWPVLAFMLAALLIYRKQYSGEQKTLDMIYKQAPRELVHLLSPLNPVPSQLRYLQYVSRRNLMSEWPPLDRALTMDCVILRFIPDFDGEGGCRPIFRVFGQDPFSVGDRTPKLLYSTPKKANKSTRAYKQAECELVKIDIKCHIQGDVVVECLSLNDDMKKEVMMFRLVFNTAFIRSNILMLNRDEIDTFWDAKDQFPRNFRVELLFSEMDAASSVVTVDFSSLEEKDGLPMEAFSKVNEIFSHVDWLDHRADVALNMLQHLSITNASQDKSDVDHNQSVATSPRAQGRTPRKIQDIVKQAVLENNAIIASSILMAESALSPRKSEPTDENKKTAFTDATSHLTSPANVRGQKTPLSTITEPDMAAASATESVDGKNLSVLPATPSPPPPKRPSLLSETTTSSPPPQGVSAVSSIIRKSEVFLQDSGQSSLDQPTSFTKAPSNNPAPPASGIILTTPPQSPAPPSPPTPPADEKQVTRAANRSRLPPAPDASSQFLQDPPAGLSSLPPKETYTCTIPTQVPPPPPAPPSPMYTSSNSQVPFSASCPAPPPPPPPPSLNTTISAGPPPPPPPPPISSGTTAGGTSNSSAVAPPPPPAPPKGPSAPPPPPPPSGKGPKIGTGPPEPPSAPGNGPPSPAPPLGSLSSGKGRMLRVNSKSHPTKKLKPLHWLKLTRAVQGSLWAETQKSGEAAKAPEIDMSELERLFPASIPTSEQGAKSRIRGFSGPKSDKVQLVDHRRAYNCEIMLSKVKVPLSDLMSSVLVLEESAMDVDQVENLIKFCPTKEEMELLKGYTGEKEKLGKCEQFLLELMKVPRVETKLRVFAFKIQFRSQVSELKNNLNIVNSAAEQIKNSFKLKRIMQTILSLGNALNQGTARGAAVGFRLDSLLKLSETRARNNKMTLMHYLCKVLADKLPEVLDFTKDLSSLESSSKIQLKVLAEEMQAINKGLEKVVQELSMAENDGPISETFRENLKDFLHLAEAEVRSLASLYSGVGRNVDALILYFGEDPARCPFEQVISTLLNFVRMFNRAHEENCKQLEIEMKKAAENEKAGKNTLEKVSQNKLETPLQSSNVK